MLVLDSENHGIGQSPNVLAGDVPERFATVREEGYRS
jgi:hypothetical protein